MLTPGHAQARPDTGLPSLNAFIATLENGDANTLRGVYVPEIFASQVVQQPAGKAAYVSSAENTLTQFELASQFESTGLLAHNRLAGKTFFLLVPGQKFYLVYGNGRTAAFVVTQTIRYRALKPTSTTSNFIDLTDGRISTAAELFKKAYDRPDDVILQTCISADGISSWGRLFVIARPYEENHRKSTSRITAP